MKPLFLYLISLYQKTKHFLHLPSSCRYSPTCSQYAYAVIQKYGIIKGVFLGIKRIIRCTPWARGGFDPIP